MISMGPEQKHGIELFKRVNAVVLASHTSLGSSFYTCALPFRPTF